MKLSILAALFVLALFPSASHAQALISCPGKVIASGQNYTITPGVTLTSSSGPCFDIAGVPGQSVTVTCGYGYDPLSPWGGVATIASNDATQPTVHINNAQTVSFLGCIINAAAGQRLSVLIENSSSVSIMHGTLSGWIDAFDTTNLNIQYQISNAPIRAIGGNYPTISWNKITTACCALVDGGILVEQHFGVPIVGAMIASNLIIGGWDYTPYTSEHGMDDGVLLSLCSHCTVYANDIRNVWDAGIEFINPIDNATIEGNYISAVGVAAISEYHNTSISDSYFHENVFCNGLFSNFGVTYTCNATSFGSNLPFFRFDHSGIPGTPPYYFARNVFEENYSYTPQSAFGGRFPNIGGSGSGGNTGGTPLVLSMFTLTPEVAVSNSFLSNYFFYGNHTTGDGINIDSTIDGSITARGNHCAFTDVAISCASM